MSTILYFFWTGFGGVPSFKLLNVIQQAVTMPQFTSEAMTMPAFISESMRLPGFTNESMVP